MGEHSEEEKSLPENKKRTVKTRAQVEALEQFYNEHKYPTETMKEELAKSIGLTEKQVSGWFCHRRLKDKRLLNPEAYANGRQDRSSGIVQDRGSGFRQDSCGSTKQGDDRNFDPREVESRRLTGQESSAADINYELGSRHVAMAKHGSPEDTSSGSSSSLRNLTFSHERSHFAVDSSRNQTQSLPGTKEFKPRTGPSGYLKVKGQVENVAITAVKRQLGGHYRADGPPLGVEFDPLPPGAFESPIVEPPNESYYTEEPVLAHSPEVSMGQRHHNSGSGYRYNSGISSHNSEIDGTGIKMARGSDHLESYYEEKFNTKSPKYNQNDIYQAKSSSTDIHEGSVRRARVYESWGTDQRASHDIGVMSLDSVSGRNQSNLYSTKINRKQTEPWLQNHKTMRSKVSASDHYDSSRLKLTSKAVENDDSKRKGLSRRIAKETKSPGEKVAGNDNFDPVRPEVLSKNEMAAAKRVKDEFLEDYNMKKPFRNDVPLWANQVTRSAAKVPSSFSEDDETADTSSAD